MSVFRLAPLAGLLALIVAGPASAQIAYPVEWSFTAKRISINTYEVHMTATVGGGWRLYSQQAGEGPVPTSIRLIKSAQIVPIGKTLELGKLVFAQDPAFDSKVRYYQNKVDFVQKIYVKGATPAALKGSVEFMASDDHQSLPPKTIDFNVKLQ